MGTTSARLLVPAIVLIFFWSSMASAGCTVPFRVSAGQLSAEVHVSCSGPSSRTSDCAVVPSGASEEQFYCAENTLFSMYGQWVCQAFVGTEESFCLSEPATFIEFCVEKSGPQVVDLAITESPSFALSITANASDACASAETVAHLGHTGAKGWKSVVKKGAPRDRDTFVFEGLAGQKVVIALAKDGTAGHTGVAAVLRVLASGDTMLDEARGPLPLELDVELPATGKIQVVIEEAANAASSGTPAPAEGFRGHYLLSVTPALGAEGLLLEPQPDAEP